MTNALRITLAIGICLVVIVAATHQPSLSYAENQAVISSTGFTVCVLYFDNNTGDPQYNNLQKGLADMVATDLAKVSGLQVVERDRLQELIKELKLQETSFFDPSTAQKLGRGVGAKFAVAGSYLTINPNMRIDIKLIEIDTSKVVVADSVEGNQNDLFSLQRDLVSHLLTRLDPSLKPPTGFLKVKKLETISNYSEGLDLSDRGQLKAASEKLALVHRSEPEFELADIRYQEVMRKLYQAKEKRNILLSDAEQTLLNNALEKAGNPKGQIGCAYSRILALLYYSQLKRIGNRGRQNDNPFGRTDNAPFHDCMLRWTRKDAVVPVSKENQDETVNLIDSYVNATMKAVKLCRSLGTIFDSPTSGIRDGAITPGDENLLEMAELSLYSSWDAQEYQQGLAGFLITGNGFFSPPPLKWVPAYEPLAFQLLDQALAAVQKNRNYVERDSCRIMEFHGALLLEAGRKSEAIQKWQEALDKYPTSECFSKIESNIKKALRN